MKKPPRENYPWQTWEKVKVRAGIKCGWKRSSQQALAGELGRSRSAVQQQSHEIRKLAKIQKAKRRKQLAKRARAKNRRS